MNGLTSPKLRLFASRMCYRFAVQTLGGQSRATNSRFWQFIGAERDETWKKAASGLGREGMFLAKPGLETGDNSWGSLFWKERVSWDFGSLWRGWKGSRFMEPGDFA